MEPKVVAGSLVISGSLAKIRRLCLPSSGFSTTAARKRSERRLMVSAISLSVAPEKV